jgi:hypothetical protein
MTSMLVAASTLRYVVETEQIRDQEFTLLLCQLLTASLDSTGRAEWTRPETSLTF